MNSLHFWTTIAPVSVKMFRILCGPKKKRLNSASIHREPELEYGKHDRKSALLIDIKRTLSRLKIIDQAHLALPQALH